jgi:DNA mismatch repair protein MutS
LEKKDDQPDKINTTPSKQNHDERVKTKQAGEEEQISLFPMEQVDDNQEEIVAQLKNLDLMSKTPMQIMNQVYKWQQKINRE